jgi:hypothetical protein
MACGAISESFPVLNAEALAARRLWVAPAGLASLSEKQYIKPQPAWQEIVDFS